MEATQAFPFGMLLKHYRVAAGLSQEALAESAGLSERAVSDLERGLRLRPHKDTVELLSAALRLGPLERVRLEAAATRARGSPPPLPSAAPPAPSTVALPRSLPLPLTRLIGREVEVAAASHLLHTEHARLLTLSGPPGVGKTRLGLEVATSHHQHYADGVVFVPLAPLSDPALVATTIAQALGLREEGGQAVQERLVAYLCDKELLLVLDNFEGVVAAAHLVVQVLEACPLLTVLLTSRVTLRVRGEQQLPVPPLALPDPARLPPLEELAHYPAIALFLERARAVRPNFALDAVNAPAIAMLCARLDGLPLAIELAAAWVKILSPQALLARLERGLPTLAEGPWDLPERYQTLHGAIAWSYSLLEAAEQTLFRRLAVFVGGCSLEAAETVCASADDLMEPDDDLAVLDGLAALAHKSLLWVEYNAGVEPRIRLLETLREYGLECLEASGEAAALRRVHAAYYLALAALAEPALSGPEQAAWLEQLEREHDNLRAALTWARESGEAEAGLRPAGALARFWEVHGHLSEGRRWLEGLLAVTGTDDTSAAMASVRAKALDGAGVLARVQGDHDHAMTLAVESLALYRDLGDKPGMARALHLQGSVASEQGDHVRAMALHEESLALYRELGHIRGTAAALGHLGNVAYWQGDYARATALYEECLGLCRTLGDTGGIANALGNLGNVAKDQGDYARAMALYDECLGLCRTLGHTWGIAAILGNLGLVAKEQSDYARATTLYEECLALFQTMGDTGSIASTLGNLGAVAYAQGDYGGATALLEESLALCRALGLKGEVATVCGTLGSVAHMQGDDEKAAALHSEALELWWAMGSMLGVALCLEGLATVACGQARMARAARVGAAAAALRETIGTPMPPADRMLFDHTVAAVRAALGDAVFAMEWSAGKTLPLADAIAEALAR